VDLKPGWPRIDAAKIGDTVESIKSMLVTPTARALVELQNMLGGGLTFTDNFKCSIVEKALTHGVEMPITCGFNPIGVYALRSEAIKDGSRYSIDSLDWRFGAPGGTIGVTAKFDLGHSGQLLEKHRTTNQTIANNTLTTVLWESTTNTRGSVITESSGSFSVTEAGVYFVSGQVNISGGALTAFQAWLEMGGNRFGDTGFFATTTADALVSTSWPITMAAGDSVKFVAYQTNAAVANRTIIGTNTNRARMAVQRLYNATVPQNNVTLLLVGG